MIKTATHLLYLHGFLSSPASNKARITGTAVARQHPGVTWLCPMLAASREWHLWVDCGGKFGPQAGVEVTGGDRLIVIYGLEWMAKFRLESVAVLTRMVKRDTQHALAQY